MMRAMKRIIFLAALVAVGVLSLGVAAFQQPPAGAAAPKVVEVEKQERAGLPERAKHIVQVLHESGTDGQTR